jgi:N-acetylglucosamine-6-phosphate deacetylase
MASSRRDPDLALLTRLLDGGPVRLMTLAPELPGAGELIDELRTRRQVSLGHSDATATQANEAFDRGVGTVTHLFNACGRSGTATPASPAPRSRATT